MRVPYMPRDEVMALDRAARPGRGRAHPRGIVRGRPHRHDRPRRQQRCHRSGHRPPRHPAQRRRRRFVVPRAVRVPARPARAVERHAHPVAQPAGDLRRAAAARGARPARRLGLSQRRHPGPAVRRLDHAARRPGDAGREDAVAHPAGHQYAPARRPHARPIRRRHRRHVDRSRPRSSARPSGSPTPWPR